MNLRTLQCEDGSTLAYLIDEESSDEWPVLVYHHGTPAAGPESGLLQAARSAGFRMVELVRPGYGPSTRQPGRRVADVAALADRLADALDADRFATIGWSGGGPHAIATSALLPDRCAAALSLAGVAPFGAAGLDWTAGMGQDNIDEFGAAAAGEEDLQAYLTAAADGLASVTGAEVVAALASLLPEVDRTYLHGGFADGFAEQVRWSLANGIWGWLDDDVAFVEPWGFDLASLRTPILVWQGSEDLMVPFAHGQWLAANLPTAQAHLAAGEGHLSLVAGIESGLAELRAML